MKKNISLGVIAAIAIGIFAALAVSKPTPSTPISAVITKNIVETAVVQTVSTTTRAEDQRRPLSDPVKQSPQQPSTRSPVSSTGAEPAPSSKTIDVTVLIEGSRYSLSLSEGSNVLSAMQKLSSQGLISITGHDYPSLGFFVEAINGKKNADSNYWFLYMNGVSSQKGVSQSIVKAGDVIEWRYEKNY